jgi:hypothetical protein
MGRKKNMKNKILLLIILLTPIAVVIASSLLFSNGISPANTNNNGVFFKDYFNFDQFSITNGNDGLKFDDGKWVLAVYVTDTEKAKDSIYFMRQLNVALNRDIYKARRITFFSNVLIEDSLKNILKEYPRTENFKDENGMLLNVLQRNSSIDMNIENPIFIIDPYGRAVIFFPKDTDPKKILKDLKRLI